jgi:hypothetical protein
MTDFKTIASTLMEVASALNDRAKEQGRGSSRTAELLDKRASELMKRSKNSDDKSPYDLSNAPGFKVRK